MRIIPIVFRKYIAFTIIENNISNHIGLVILLTLKTFRDETMSEEVVEKQAELIRYLKEHNAQLGKRVLQLTAAQQQQST